MSQDDFIRVANKAQARSKIQNSIYLDQQYLKGKQPLQMSLNSRNNQPEKAQKSSASSQSPGQDKITRSTKKPRPKRLRKRSGRKRKKQETKENKMDKYDKIVALLQQELILPRPQKAKKRSNIMARTLRKTFLRSLIIIVIKRSLFQNLH